MIKNKGAGEFVGTSIPNLFASSTKEKHPELIDEQVSNASGFSAEALIAYQTAMMERKDRRDVLKKASVPVLFVLGKYDNAVPLKDGLEQSSLPNNSLVEILENSGHAGMKEEPQKSNQVLLEFLFLQKASHSF